MSSTSRSMNFSHSNRHFEADRLRTLHALGNLSSINPEASAVPLSTNYLHTVNYAPSSTVSGPPPLPPRAEASRSVDRYSRYSGMNNYYSPYSRFSPGMYSPAYGGFRAPYNRYGMPPESYNSFIQLAEESTRPAFESIESVVDIVGSISMMLESTYHAVHSSYSAILGVVDQFSRLRDHLAEVLSFLAVLRGLKYLCLKILYLLRLRKDNPSVEAAWNSATAVSGNELSKLPDDGKSPWPFFMFLGLVVGAPWLMFKLLARSVANKKLFDISTWKLQDGRLRATYAAYDFDTNRRGEISFRAGDILYLAPSHLQKAPKGWMLAYNKQRNVVGLIPQNYLKTQAMSTALNSLKPKMTPVNPKAAVVVQRVPMNSIEHPFSNVESSSMNNAENINDPSSEYHSSTKAVVPEDPIVSSGACNSSNEDSHSGKVTTLEDSVEGDVVNMCNPSSEDSVSEDIPDPFAVDPKIDVENDQN